MREAGLKAKGRQKYKATTDSEHALPIAPNLLERELRTDRPNTAWVSDITYIWTRQGWM
jgi:transposase InsO family protein